MLDNFLPSFRQIYYSTLIELLAFLGKKLNHVRFYSVAINESFTTPSAKTEINGSLKLQFPGYIVLFAYPNDKFKELHFIDKFIGNIYWEIADNIACFDSHYTFLK